MERVKDLISKYTEGSDIKFDLRNKANKGYTYMGNSSKLELDDEEEGLGTHFDDEIQKGNDPESQQAIQKSKEHDEEDADYQITTSSN
jgi:hypothetical protein